MSEPEALREKDGNDKETSFSLTLLPQQYQGEKF